MSATPPVPARDWDAARKIASSAARLPPVEVALGAAGGGVLAQDLISGCDLPPADVAAMDGWAVAGPGPWRNSGTLLAGALWPRLNIGEAVAVATGAWLPEGTTAVLRRERGQESGGVVSGEAPAGADVRRAGQEVRAGERLLSAGTVVTPAVLALAAAAGADTLRIARRASVHVLVLGDELLDSGLPRGGRVRDALGPALPEWIASYGVATPSLTRVPDAAGALAIAVTSAGESPLGADVVVTTGGTAAGPVDHVRRTIIELGGQTLVDSVRVRPGHPMLMGRLPGGRWWVGLPGNPLAAVSGILTLLEPLLGALAGRASLLGQVRLAKDVAGHPTDTRLIPVRSGLPSMHAGPAMLRGLATADAVAVIPPGGAAAGAVVRALPLPWQIAVPPSLP